MILKQYFVNEKLILFLYFEIRFSVFTFSEKKSKIHVEMSQ